MFSVPEKLAVGPLLRKLPDALPVIVPPRGETVSAAVTRLVETTSRCSESVPPSEPLA